MIRDWLRSLAAERTPAECGCICVHCHAGDHPTSCRCMAEHAHAVMSNREKVAAIRQAWHELMPEEPPITYGSGPVVDLDLYAQIAINVLTDWHKRSTWPVGNQP